MAKNPKNAVAEEQDDGIREKMIAVNRVTKVVKGGRILGFAALTVVAAVQQGGFQADHGITGQHALLSGKADALFNSREEVLRHAVAEHLLFEDDLLAVAGLEVDDDITELAVAAGLLLMTALLLAGLADGLAVGEIGRASCRERV